MSVEKTKLLSELKRIASIGDKGSEEYYKVTGGHNRFGHNGMDLTDALIRGALKGSIERLITDIEESKL